MIQHLYNTDTKIVAYVVPIILDVKEIETNIKPMIKNFEEQFNKVKLEIKKFLVKKRVLELEEDFHK
jgi:malic enzyme